MVTERSEMQNAGRNDPSAFGYYEPTPLIRRLIAETRRCDATWAGKRKAFFLRGLAVRALAGRPVDFEALGAKMRLYPANNVCEKRILFTPQYFDEPERKAVEPFIGPDVVFVDIGASAGGYALWAASVAGRGAKILAVEPEPQSFGRLCFNIAANTSGAIKAINAAVADFAGRLTLFADRRNLGGTGVRIGRHSDGTDSGFDVQAITLQGLVESEGLRRIDVLKVDVEGAEDIVLIPFLRNAGKDLLPRVIVLNRLRHQWAEDLASVLEATGYRSILTTITNEIWTRD